MLRQRSIDHKRKNSQLDLFYPQSSSNKISQQKHHSGVNNSKSKANKNTANNCGQNSKNNKNNIKRSLDALKVKSQNGKNILKLISNSQNKVHKKQTVIQSINDEQFDQNFDHSNKNTGYSAQGSQDQQNDAFFQFGKKERNSSLERQSINSIYNCLNMQQIIEVPDTMSNQRRYQTSNFYQFPTSNQNSLINFSNKLNDNEFLQQTNLDTHQQKKTFEKLFSKIQGEHLNKNLKQRKQKGPKNIVIQDEQTANHEKLDLTDLIQEKKKKLLFLNKKDEKRSKSRQFKKIQKQKSKGSLLSSKKSKNLSQAILPKKKSLSLRNEDKIILKPLQKKGKSFQKASSQGKAPYYQSTKSNKSVKSIQPNANVSKQKNLQIGDKITMIEQSQSKLQNQYKILWQCVGQLWQNSRITRYVKFTSQIQISQKNKSDIIKIKDNEKMQDQKLIKLKSQIINSISSARY